MRALTDQVLGLRPGTSDPTRNPPLGSTFTIGERANLARLMGALHVDGRELTDREARILRWLAVWDEDVVGTIVGLFERAAGKETH